MSTALASAAAMPAFAQDSDSVTIEVFAELFTPSAPVTVTGTQALDFGTVGIPGEATTCFYEIGEGISSGGDVGPTPLISSTGSGTCDWIDPTLSFAEFSINCEAGEELNFSLSNSLNGSVSSQNLSVDATLLDAPDADIFFGETTPICPSSGAFDVRASGQLNVTSDAEIAASSTIGQLTLDVSY